MIFILKKIHEIRGRNLQTLKNCYPYLVFSEHGEGIIDGCVDRLNKA